MKYVVTFADSRQTGWCMHCGGPLGTRDHVPSRVFLDEPYPDNLPVVPACGPCNASFSQDEEYVASVIDCVLTGSAEPENMRRTKVSNILKRSPGLAARLAQACVKDESAGTIAFNAEMPRVRNVILKLARGHSAFELSEPRFEEPDSISITPLIALDDAQRASFEEVPSSSIYPEIGSRAFVLVCNDDPEATGWQVVEPGRYRYLVSQYGGVVVRLVIAEYLAAEIIWE